MRNDWYHKRSQLTKNYVFIDNVVVRKAIVMIVAKRDFSLDIYCKVGELKNIQHKHFKH